LNVIGSSASPRATEVRRDGVGDVAARQHDPEVPVAVDWPSMTIARSSSASPSSGGVYL
jgi:hypothetical protein